MFYFFLKIPIRLALRIFCRKIKVGHKKALSSRGPLLLVANHPNSFLDAIIIGSLFKRPVHFLARGDAFNKSWHSRILRMMNMIPVYRMSEGRENLHLNTAAFSRSRELLNTGGIVLIFIEGICVNKHEMQPFKKGAARIALESKLLHNFRVLPIGMAYDSFHQFGKTVHINVGEEIPIHALLPFADPVTNIKYFNDCMRKEIEKRIDIPETIDRTNTIQVLLKPLSLLGFIIHIKPYQLLSFELKQKTKGTVFYDSVLFGSLLILYPLIILLLLLLLYWIGVHPIILLLLLFLFPFSAWCAVQHKQK